MYKFKIKLPYSKEEFFCIKTELFNFKIILPFPKLGIIVAKLEWNGLIFSGDTPVDIQFIAFFN